MTPADRWRKFIDDTAKWCADRLRGWMASWLGFGIEIFFDILGKAAAPKLKPFIDTLEASGELPPEMQPILDELKTPSGQAAAILANSAGGAIIGGAIGKVVDALFLRFAYDVNSRFHPAILAPPELLTLWRRGLIDIASLDTYLKKHGLDDDARSQLTWLTKWLPGPQELTTWLAKEVFEPDMVARYGLDDEYPAGALDEYYKVGVEPDQVTNWWRAHWQHASWMQVVEMLHRDLLTEAEVWDWFRVVEIPPYWRQLLIDTAYTWPTRVDVRRWWDMRTIDETELRRLYSGMGYRGVNLDNYVLWTKVYVAYPDLLARWSKGWISLDDVRSELTGLGMPAERVEEMIQTKVMPTESERVSSERDLTKTDIYKGVKQGVLARGEGIELLMDLGFDEDEADYLLAINIPTDETAAVVSERQLSKTDILNGLKTEIITRPLALDKLLGLRYSATDAEFLLKIYDAQVKPPTEAREREASKADIVLGVKKGLITQEEGYGMLLDLGFTAEAAQFILMVKTEESPFSPINFAEFKDLTQKYRIAAGKEVKPMSEELKAAGAEVVKLTSDVKALQTTIAAEERKLIAQEVLPEAATAKRDELRVALHRAESALAAAQTDYDSLLAQWRHGG